MNTKPCQAISGALLVFTVLAVQAAATKTESDLKPVAAPDTGGDNSSLSQFAPGENRLPAPPAGYQWQKIHSLSDEFGGDRLDESKWIPRHPYWRGRNSRHEESNVAVVAGKLQLKSTLRESAREVNASNVTAACVASTTPRCHYGYYEARIKCSNISMTSAFWFQGKYSEIDVIENVGNASEPKSAWINDTMMINTHYFKAGWKNDRATPVKWKMPSRAGDAYHVYGVWWKDTNTVWFYHHGAKVAEVSSGGPFEEQQYMFFDTEVFAWHGWPTKESLLDPKMNTMLVDWVRAWQLVKTAPAAPKSAAQQKEPQ
jgi:hypothetical protein